MKFSRLLLVLVFAGRLAGAEPQIRVLIVDGYSNHDWRLTTELIRGIVEPTGLFAVSVSTAPATNDAAGWDAWRPKFSDYDVVIQTCNDLGGGPSWPRVVQEDFESFVRNGGGVYVWHAGNNAFAGWPAYNEMIGLGWRKKDFGWALSIDPGGKIVRIPAGEGRDTGHGTRLDTVVQRLGDHAIHAGLPRAWKTPDIEVYYYARGPAQNLEVLSYGYDPETKTNWPLEWTVAYGQGRVYTSTFGHVWKGDTQPDRMRCAGVQTIVVRALQWLAGRPVTFPVPADFPSADRVSVRGEIARENPAVPTLLTEFVYEAVVTVDAPVAIGPTPHGGGATFPSPAARSPVQKYAALFWPEAPTGRPTGPTVSPRRMRFTRSAPRTARSSSCATRVSSPPAAPTCAPRYGSTHRRGPTPGSISRNLSAPSPAGRAPALSSSASFACFDFPFPRSQTP
jgi:hypothetical protein